MISILVVLHVILMVASLAVTGISTLSAFAGHAISRTALFANGIVTATGVLCGLLLMMSLPLDMRCIVLFGYVAAFGLAQFYILRRNQELSAPSGV